jgi:hypothetical protein
LKYVKFEEKPTIFKKDANGALYALGACVGNQYT